MLTDLIIQYCQNCDTVLALGPIAAAGIMAGLGLATNAANSMIQGAIGAGQSEAQTKRQYIWNKYQNTYLREWAHEDRDEQRQYDLPINERNRWSMAGYNPQAVFGQFSQSQPTMPNYTTSGPGALVQPNMPPIDLADISNKLADTQLKHAQASREKAEEDAIRGSDNRANDLHQYQVRYQDALATLTHDANHRAEVQQQMEADQNAAERNAMQAAIDATIEKLRIDDNAQKEIARHNLQTEILARYEAETNRKNAITAANEAAARIKYMGQQVEELRARTAALQRDNYLNFGFDALTIPVPKTFAKQIPSSLQPYVVKTKSGATELRLKYDQLSQLSERQQRAFVTHMMSVDNKYYKTRSQLQVFQGFLKAFTNFQEGSNAIGANVGGNSSSPSRVQVK